MFIFPERKILKSFTNNSKNDGRKRKPVSSSEIWKIKRIGGHISFLLITSVKNFTKIGVGCFQNCI